MLFYGVFSSVKGFLAGGITGTKNWQAEVVDKLRTTDLILFNPRRDSFPMDDPDAGEEQIVWEFKHLSSARIVLFWFPPETLCPIALYELGRMVGNGKPIFVGADKNYKRLFDLKVQLGLAVPHLDLVYNLDDLVAQLMDYIT